MSVDLYRGTALVSVAGMDLPWPSSYTANTATIVDSARNAEGRVIGAVIRDDVAKVELQWRYLTVETWAKILTKFNTSFYNDVRFYNQATANYETRKMYVGDRKAGIGKVDWRTGRVMGWTDCALSLIEV